MELIERFTKTLMERASPGESTQHPDCEKGVPEKPADGEANRRNGTSLKTVITDYSKVDVDVQRHLRGTFAPGVTA